MAFKEKPATQTIEITKLYGLPFDISFVRGCKNVNPQRVDERLINSQEEEQIKEYYTQYLTFLFGDFARLEFFAGQQFVRFQEAPWCN